MEKREVQKGERGKQAAKQKKLLSDGQDKLFSLFELFNTLIKEAKEGGVPQEGLQSLVECREKIFNCHVQRGQSIMNSIR